MATLSLKISIDGGTVVKTIQLEPSTTIFDACRVIREKILEAGTGDQKDYGLFLASEEDSKKGIWLEPSRTLDYYMLRNGDLLEYGRKTRNLRVKMLDGTVKTIQVDDSQVVANLMVVICSKIGITNHDEYGLVREESKEEPDPCEKPNYGTLTLRRKHHDKERDAKMEHLRKKLRTDDEVNWVEPSKTLREQGVEGGETLLLRRRLFFSDRNVDSRDPVQLLLLYAQAHNAIINQHHPVTQDKACEFAGIQCQIQFGDHKEDKHTPGFLDLKEFLPESYIKVKNIEKKIFKEHRKHAGLSELDAKVLYTKTARDLKTYGVAFFLVKEKMKGKNKLVPRLLGITKDSVLRLDEKTKEILQTWPLTTVRRWCASPNTFTLDFGDYSDQYYSVQTSEPDQIQAVLAGYIDMIVRRQQNKEHIGIDGDHGAAMLEDTVAPNKANIIQHDTFKSGKVSTESVAKPAVMRPGAEGAKSFALGHHTSAQQTTISGQIVTGHTPPAANQAQQTKVTSLITEPQRALLSTISSGKEVIKYTEESLTRAQLPSLGQDAQSIKWRESTMASSRQAVTSHIAAMNAATAQVVTLTSGTTEEVDHTAVGAAITTITTNLPEMTKGVQMIAALMDDNDNGERLLDATRKLCSAFTDLLKAAEPDTKEPRQNLLNAASRVGEASTSVLYTITDEPPEDKETQDILLSLAKAVANTTAALVLKAKHVAAQCKEEQQLQTNIIACATNAALATSQLVACAKVVAPTLHNPACREQLTAAARLVAQSVERLVAACEPVQDKEGVQQLTEAAKRVTIELERLLAHCDTEPRTGTISERAVESVLAASSLVAGASDASDMVRQARLLGQATAHLITTIKTEAEKEPSDNQRKLLAAAKLLADATTRMVEAARQCASSPQDREKQEALRQAAEELRFITTDYGHTRDVVGSQIARLQESARNTASCATQLVTSAQSAAQYNTNKYAQETLDEECHKLWQQVGRSVDSIRSSTSHLQLINTSTNLLRSSNLAIQASRAALPTVSDAAANKHLSDTTHHLADACSDLRSAVSRARISTKGTEMDAAMELIKSLQSELEEFAKATDFTLLPGQTAEWSSATLSSAQRGAASASSQLVSCATSHEKAGCGQATAELAAELKDFTDGAKVAVVLANYDEPRKERIITSSREVLQSSYILVETVKRYITHGEDQQLPNIVTLAREMTQGMKRTLEAVPSHAELDAALETVNETLDVLDMGEFPPSDRPYGELQSELASTAASLSQAATSVASTCAGADARVFSDRFSALTNTAMEIAGRTQDREVQSEMVTTMKSVTINSSKLLSTVKSVSQDATRPNAKNQLIAAARSVTDSINKLVDVCTEAAPGQKHCAAAMLRIESARGILEGGNQPVNELGYFACVDAVVDASKQLSEGMSGLAGAARGAGEAAWGGATGALADAACSLAECAAQAAYLVGVSDPSSVAGRVGLVDQAQLSRAADHIQRACQLLCDPNTHQQQVVTAATAIAKHTSALCHACRYASARSAEPRAKRHFVQAAKDVANCTSSLVKLIKALDNNYNEENRQQCASATVPLLDAVDALVQFTDRPEFASVPARISPDARRAQRPILDAGKDILSGTISMLEASRSLALSPNSRPHWQDLASHSKQVSDCIKTLVTTIRAKAPGQKECEAALAVIKAQQRELDQAAIHSAQGLLPPNTKYTLQGFCEQLESSCSEMMERLEPVKTAATGQVENLGHAVNHLVSYITPLTTSSIGALSHISDASISNELTDRSRSVLESVAMLVKSAATHAHTNHSSSTSGEISAQLSLSHTALSELSSLSRELSTQAGGVAALLDSISKATHRLTQNRMSLIGSYDETDTFVQYQTRIIAEAKEIARLANDMTAKSVTEPSALVAVGSELCSHYEKLAADVLGASATATSTEIATRIRTTVSELGDAVSGLVAAGGRCRLCADTHNKNAVASSADLVNEKVMSLVSALQSGGGGAQACVSACATLTAILSDLDTTILFASAGTLHSEIENDQFSSHREGILQTAKVLVEHTKLLVGGCSSQQGLASAAHTAVNTVVSLCEVVKQGAMSLGSSNPEPQVLVLHAARDVTAALRDLVSATASAAGKPMAHPDMEALKHAAKRLCDTKRWSLPVKSTLTKPNKRWSLTSGIRNEYNSCDSETDIFQSDQEEELVKLLDYSSHDDDVSPSLFFDNCEETIAYIESKMINPSKRVPDYNLNVKYNMAARNSLVDMDWRVLKYGENILLGEVKKLVDDVLEIDDRQEEKRKLKVLKRLKAETVLDTELKRMSQVIEEMDTDIEIDELSKKIKLPSPPIETVPEKKVNVEKQRLKSPVFNITKVKPVNLVLDLDAKDKIEKIDSPPKVQSPVTTTEQRTVVIFNKDFADVKKQFWDLFKDETEWWKALAKRNLDKMNETRRELERFSKHELITGEYQKAIDQFDKEKHQLQRFIEEINTSKTVNTDLQYNKKYEEMVLKLIDFAKKDFIYKGFDPLIDQLKSLSNTELPGRKKQIVNIQDIINIYTQIDISKYTYEELCILEKHYKELIKKYKSNAHEKVEEKENIVPLKNKIPIRDTRSASPGYHRNVILNIHSTENTTKNVHQYSHNTHNIGGSLNRHKNREHKSRNNIEIFDLTRTYPEEYYANNWWSIYEDILKNREEKFGSIDNWWKFYESILNKEQTTDEEIKRIRAVVEYRNSLRKRPTSRLEQHMKMLDAIKNDRFKETEAITTEDNQSVMVTNVTSLLKTVKAVEDEHTRGTRALESTIEAINQEIEFLHSAAPSDGPTSPEELIRRTRQMTLATAKAVAAGNSGKQDQLVAAANLGRKTVVDLLRACKACAHAADSADLQDKTIFAGETAAMTYKELLVAVLEGHKNKLPDLSRHVAKAVQDIIGAGELLKGSDWVDPADPAVVAETELLSAAATIDAAANKLASLRPRKTLHHETDETLNFDEMILEAAKCIISATSALVRAASSAQRELIDQGKVARRPAQSSDDGQWSEGLVSAARLVAAAAHSLVEAANALVQGVGSEERLVSAARSVAAGTAQLLVACKVKADPAAESTRRLQSAGAEVIRSTDNLVRAARDAVARDDERSLVLNRRMVGGIAQEIDARSEVLRIEKELDEARGRLAAIRQAKYKLKTESGEDTGDDTDVSITARHTQRFKSPTSSFVNTTYSPNSSFTPHTTLNNTSLNTTNLNTSNLSHNISQLNQSIHGSPAPTYGQSTYDQTRLGQNSSSFGQNSTSFGQNSTSFGQNTSNTSNYSQTTTTKNTEGQNGYDKFSRVEEKQYSATSPSFSSFRPQEDGPKQNYEGFTTRTSVTEETVVVKSLQLPEVRKALLVEDNVDGERIYYRRDPAPPPPPRRLTLHNYETRLYDTPRPTNEYTTSEEKRQFESNQYYSKQEQKFGYDAPKVTTPLSPKFNARELKFDTSTEPIYSTLKKPTTPKSPLDGVGQTFSEHKKSTEKIPGGTIQSEYSVKSESYQSYPKTEFSKIETRQEVKSPFVTSTPAKDFSQYEFGKSTDLVKAATPDYDRIASPYGKEVYSYGGPNFKEETTTEVKEIPNGTQKITTTKIYSSSPVNLTSTSTKYEPMPKLDGIDELSKSFDNDSRYSTLDSRFNTLDSKMSSDTSRSFMRPSEFQSSDYQASSSVTKVKKPSDLVKEIDTMGNKFSKQTITSETIERKSVMTSSHKSEKSSTVTKKFGNF